MKISIRTLGCPEEIPWRLLEQADPSPELIREYVPRGLCRGAILQGKTVGACVLLLTKPLTLELVNLSVSSPFQKKGIGRALIEDAVQIAERQKRRVLEVGTGSTSIGALLFYQKCGFRVSGVERDYFRIRYDCPIRENGLQCTDLIRLERVLTAPDS